MKLFFSLSAALVITALSGQAAETDLKFKVAVYPEVWTRPSLSSPDIPVLVMLSVTNVGEEPRLISFETPLRLTLTNSEGSSVAVSTGSDTLLNPTRRDFRVLQPRGAVLASNLELSLASTDKGVVLKGKDLRGGFLTSELLEAGRYKLTVTYVSKEKVSKFVEEMLGQPALGQIWRGKITESVEIEVK